MRVLCDPMRALWDAHAGAVRPHAGAVEAVLDHTLHALPMGSPTSG